MPRIGLLSDSHGRAVTTRLGVQALLATGIDLLIHLGDVGSVEVIDELVVHQPTPAPGLTPVSPVSPSSSGSQDPIPVRLVFGNSDWDIGPLSKYAQCLGIQVNHPVGHIDLPPTPGATPAPGIASGTTHDARPVTSPAPRQLVFCHGHQSQPMTRALAQNAAYLCHGHTHQASDTRSGSTRIINPGALCRAHQYTVAVLDTDNDQLTFLPVPATA